MRSIYLLNGYWWRMPWGGLLVALLLLFMVETWLHTDNFYYQYRAVFAAGRAMDKVLHVGVQAPRLLLLGNSRIDNGFDPRVLSATLQLGEPQAVFNMGMPGINMRGLNELVNRLHREGVFGSGRVEWVILGLDETLFQSDDELGYTVVFGKPLDLLAESNLSDALKGVVRLWGFAPNLRGLREPGRLERFLQASWVGVEPWGGSASSSLGYRAGEEEAFQDAQQVARQEASAQVAPDPAMVKALWRLLDRLQSLEVKVAVLYPPLLYRDVLFLTPDNPAAIPYITLARFIRQREIPELSLDAASQRNTMDFANAGHLNRRGSLRYSTLLAGQLRRIWPELENLN